MAKKYILSGKSYQDGITIKSPNFSYTLRQGQNIKLELSKRSDNELTTLLSLGLYLVLIPDMFAAMVCFLCHWNLHFQIILANLFRLGYLLYNIFASKIINNYELRKFHGAEHKVLRCYKKGLKLNIRNAKSVSRVSTNCGTNILTANVIVIQIIYLFARTHFQSISAVILFEVVLAVSALVITEIMIKLFPPLNIPGAIFQILFTTSEPEERHIEVAIKALEKVVEAEEMMMQESIKTFLNWIQPKKI